MFRILIALAVATSTASAQLVEPAPPKPIVPVDTFSAEGADVDTLAKILGDQFPGIKFSADRVSSTIFARVDGEDADRVKRLIEEVRIRAVDANHRRQKIEEQALKDDKALRRAETETESQSDPLSQLQSYQLKHISADEAARVLSLLAYDEQAVIAVAGSNLLVRASAGALDQISEVLKEMDRPSPPSPPSAQPEQLFQRAVEMASDIEPALAEQKIRQLTEQEFDADQQEMKLLQMQALELAHVVRANEDPKYHAELMEALHQNVSQQFHRKLAHDRREMEQIRRRLDQISQRLEMQERLAGRIIDQRVQELIQGRAEQASDKDLKRAGTSEFPSGRTEAVARQKLEQLKALENVLSELARKEREDDKLIRMRKTLEAEYHALRQQLMPSENVLSPDESEFRPGQNQASDLKEFYEDRKQSHELQTLKKLELELEKLNAIEQQKGVKLQGELAERKTQLEAVYLSLKRRLYPDDPERRLDLEVADDVEEVIPDELNEEEIPVVVPEDSEQA